MAADTFNTVKDILSIVTPFAILYIGYRNNKKDKKDEAYRKLREENEKLEKRIAEKDQRERDAKVTELQSDVKGLKTNVAELTKNMGVLSEEIATKVNDTLDDVLVRQDVNLAYCQSLSSLITTIGEGLRDQKMNGNLTDAINKHQAKERELFASVFKSTC